MLDARVGRTRDGLAAIGSVVERDDDFVDPAAHAREAAREIVRLVFRDDDDGEWKWS
jgi:hypothetical protein